MDSETFQHFSHFADAEAAGHEAMAKKKTYLEDAVLNIECLS